MTTTAESTHEPAEEQCWCCSSAGTHDRMVHLGNHPEVNICLRCARFVAKSGREIEDRDKQGMAVVMRERARSVRKTVVQRGWHNAPVVGPALRWLGRRTP